MFVGLGAVVVRPAVACVVVELLGVQRALRYCALSALFPRIPGGGVPWYLLLNYLFSQPLAMAAGCECKQGACLQDCLQVCATTRNR
jgi:hypothetical protein